MKRYLSSTIFAFSLFLGATTSYAAPRVIPRLEGGAAPNRVAPLTSTIGLDHPHAEKVVRLANAKVLLADYPLIKHDFGKALEKRFNKKLDQISNDEIDSWVLDSAAYTSLPQTRQENVNTHIPTTEKQVTAYRPRDYGRAIVFNPEPGVMIDAKGTGATHPKQGDHSSGLATLGEMIREFAEDKLVSTIAEHAGEGQKVVGHYAVIDAGFDVKWADGNQDRAGIILRQAHVRAPGDKSALDNKLTLSIEKTLRRYGVTSAGAYQNDPYDRINLQGTKDGAFLDFGGFLVTDHFSKPAYHFDHAPDSSDHAHPLLNPKNADFVQPNPALAVPTGIWGYTQSGVADPIKDNPSIWSYELARSIQQGRANRGDAEQHMRNLLGPVQEKLSHVPRGTGAPVAATAAAQ